MEIYCEGTVVNPNRRTYFGVSNLGVFNLGILKHVRGSEMRGFRIIKDNFDFS